MDAGPQCRTLEAMASRTEIWSIKRCDRRRRFHFKRPEYKFRSAAKRHATATAFG